MVELSNVAASAVLNARDVDSETWRLRAAACELLALSLRYPTPDLVGILNEQDWAGAAKEIADALDMMLPAGWADDLGEADLSALRIEATRLMLDVPVPICSPYEGVWRAGGDGVQPLLFVNPHSVNVEGFFKECGLGRPEGTNEPLDHVVAELEFLQYAASIAAGIAAPFEGGPAVEEFPGHGAGQAYEVFMVDHALAWMPRFADKLAVESRIPFYRAVGQYLAAFLAL